ncbi:hypothetical protein [Streptococcus pneumoniae]|uniref:hypothetical protein n=1 Tax=Streptococcus pneumoniae TaxID=1313 RepID=UPI00125D4BF7|nr:hypothetical protein [Streptococcus pneumoniae]
MKIKEQTRKLVAGCSKWKLAAGCSKQRFEPADETDEVSSKHDFEVVIELTKSVTILQIN